LRVEGVGLVGYVQVDSVVNIQSAAESKGNTLKDLRDFYAKDKAGIWP